MHEREGDYTVLFSWFFKKIFAEGLSRQEFENLKDRPIGHGILEEFIQANIAAGNYEWKKNRLFNCQKNNFLDLGEKELKKLSLGAMRAKVSEIEYVSRLVAKSLAE